MEGEDKDVSKYDISDESFLKLKEHREKGKG